eukprot:8020636-Pyramimonas_sp.AAC.1
MEPTGPDLQDRPHGPPRLNAPCNRSRQSDALAKRMIGPKYKQCRESMAKLFVGLVPTSSENSGHRWFTGSTIFESDV